MGPEGAQRRRAWEGAVSGSAESIENGQAEPQEILGAGIERIRSPVKTKTPRFPERPLCRRLAILRGDRRRAPEAGDGRSEGVDFGTLPHSKRLQDGNPGVVNFVQTAFSRRP
jgi:hypothetical protein